jgi:ABC-2 type transport system ATP-binding protein
MLKETYQKLWCSKALDNISFSINKGEIVGLGSQWRWKIDLDENITTYINADEGDALVNGHNAPTRKRYTTLGIWAQCCI